MSPRKLSRDAVREYVRHLLDSRRFATVGNTVDRFSSGPLGFSTRNLWQELADRYPDGPGDDPDLTKLIADTYRDLVSHWHCDTIERHRIEGFTECELPWNESSARFRKLQEDKETNVA